MLGCDVDQTSGLHVLARYQLRHHAHTPARQGGAKFLFGHDALALNKVGGAIESVAVQAINTPARCQFDYLN